LRTFCFATKRLKKRKNPSADSVTFVPLCGENSVVAAVPPGLASIREEILRGAVREKFNSVGGGETTHDFLEKLPETTHPRKSVARNCKSFFLRALAKLPRIAGVYRGTNGKSFRRIGELP
jgi:hypothetical protein